MSKYSQSNTLPLLVAMQVTRQWSSFCCQLELVQRWVYAPSPEGGREGRREPQCVCCPSAHESCFTLSCLPSPPPTSPSLPSQEVDCHGNVVQERVEQAMEEIKDRLTFLEKRGRAEVGEELEAKYPCTCTDCDL